MNKLQAKEIFKKLQLGNVVNLPKPVKGGLVHKMWQVGGDTKTYAIKQLSKSIEFNENILEEFELSEKIANQFNYEGIPAISAIPCNEKYLINSLDDVFMVYPWIDARAIIHKVPSKLHAMKIASVLAKIHSIDLKLEDMPSKPFNFINSEILDELIGEVLKKPSIFKVLLKKYQNDLLVINNCYLLAMDDIKSNEVVTHGDLDQKNVLWDVNDDPILIDWESAKLLNPTYDLINVALDWSGLSSNNFDENVFIEMIKVYTLVCGKLNYDYLDLVLYCIAGNWINWLNFNLNRFVNPSDADQRKISVEQIIIALNNIISLKNMHSKLLNLIHSII